MADRVKQENFLVQKENLLNELIEGGSAYRAYTKALGQFVQSLPDYIDDLQRDLGFDTYERMMKDPAVWSAVETIKTLILSSGVRLVNPIPAPSQFAKEPDKQADYDKAREIFEFIDEMMGKLNLQDILLEMLDYLAYGHVLAEKVYEADGEKLILTKLKVKPPSTYSFVVDKYINLVGVIGMKNGVKLSIPTDEDIILPSKCMILINNPRSGDPRGTSVLRQAYNVWYLKNGVWPNYLKYLSMFGTPSIAGILPEEGYGDVELRDEDGNYLEDANGNRITIGAAQDMVKKLVAFSNGTAIALQPGSKVELIQASGDGGAYISAIDMFDRQITKAILLTTRATMEAEHGSKADSQTSQAVLSEYCQMKQRTLERVFFTDVIYPTVVLNFGEEVAKKYCPKLDLSNVAKDDKIATGGMIASLAQANLLHSSQYQAIDAMLGLPERDLEAQMADEEEAKNNESMMKGLFPKPTEKPTPNEKPTK